MPPRCNVIIGHVDGAPPACQSSQSRSKAKAATNVVIGEVTPSGQQAPSVPRQKKDSKREIVIQGSSEDDSEDDDLDNKPQAKVCIHGLISEMSLDYH